MRRASKSPFSYHPTAVPPYRLYRKHIVNDGDKLQDLRNPLTGACR